MLEDKLLIWKFNRGNRNVLRGIYEKYKDDLVTLAAALLNDVSSAEDVVHEVFVSFIESSRKFRLTGTLKSKPGPDGFKQPGIYCDIRRRIASVELGPWAASVRAAGSFAPAYLQRDEV
jgi:hypothetical protein